MKALFGLGLAGLALGACNKGGEDSSDTSDSSNYQGARMQSTDTGWRLTAPQWLDSGDTGGGSDTGN